MEYKAIVFDVDRTLIHTHPEYDFYIVKTVIENFGIKAKKHYIDKFLYEPDKNKTIKEYFKLNKIDFWNEVKRIMSAEERITNSVPFSDVDFIKSIRTE